jgi:hypothetical protein
MHKTRLLRLFVALLGLICLGLDSRARAQSSFTEDFEGYTADAGPGQNLPIAAYHFQDPSGWSIVSAAAQTAAGVSHPTGNALVADIARGDGNPSFVTKAVFDGANGDGDFVYDFYVNQTSGTQSLFGFVRGLNTTNNFELTFTGVMWELHFNGTTLNSLTIYMKANGFGEQTFSNLNLTGQANRTWYRLLLRCWHNQIGVYFQRPTSHGEDGKWLSPADLSSWQTAQQPIVRFQDNALNGPGQMGWGAYDSAPGTIYWDNIGWSPAPAPLTFARTAPPTITGLTSTTVHLSAIAPDNIPGDGVTYQWQRGVSPTALSDIAGANALTLNDSGLNPDTLTYYQLVAAPTIGSAVISAQVAVRTATLASASRTNGPAFYIDGIAGNDTAPGTQAEPWRTFANLADTRFLPGDTIYLTSGQTFHGPLTLLNQTGASGSPITLTSTDPANPAVIVNMAGNCIELKNTQWVSVSYVHCLGPGLDSTAHTISTAGGAGALAGHGVLITSDLATPLYPLRNPQPYKGEDWRGHRWQGNVVDHCEVNGLYEGVTIFAPGTHEEFVPTGYHIHLLPGQDSPIVSNCNIHDCAHCGLYAFAETLHRDPASPDSRYIDPQNDPNAVNKAERIDPAINFNLDISREYAHRNVQFLSNTLTNIPGDSSYAATWTGSGIVMSNTDGGLGQRNLTSHTGDWQFFGSGGPVCQWMMNCQNVVFSQCSADHGITGGAGDGGSYDIDGGSINCTIERCLSFQSKAGYITGGYGDRATVGATFKNCISYLDSPNPFVSSSVKTIVQNCTFYIPPKGLLALGTPYIVFANNTLSFVDTGSVLLSANVQFTHNHIFSYTGAAISVTGGTQTSTIGGDPLFTSRSTVPSGDLSALLAYNGLDPTPGSPLQNAGFDFTGLTQQSYVPVGTPAGTSNLDFHSTPIPPGQYDVGAITFPEPVTDVTQLVQVKRGVFLYRRATGHFVQTVTLTNTGAGAIPGSVSLVLDGLSANATLFNRTGSTLFTSPAGNPYIDVTASDLASGASATINLEFTDPSRGAITYTTRVLSGPGSR